jgi:hypothetical protein
VDAIDRESPFKSNCSTVVDAIERIEIEGSRDEGMASKTKHPIRFAVLASFAVFFLVKITHPACRSRPHPHLDPENHPGHPIVNRPTTPNNTIILGRTIDATSSHGRHDPMRDLHPSHHDQYHQYQ